MTSSATEFCSRSTYLRAGQACSSSLSSSLSSSRRQLLRLIILLIVSATTAQRTPQKENVGLCAQQESQARAGSPDRYSRCRPCSASGLASCTLHFIVLADAMRGKNPVSSRKSILGHQIFSIPVKSSKHAGFAPTIRSRAFSSSQSGTRHPQKYSRPPPQAPRAGAVTRRRTAARKGGSKSCRVSGPDPAVARWHSAAAVMPHCPKKLNEIRHSSSPQAVG